MSEMTYTRCPICHGIGRVGQSPCPCAGSSTPGWAPTGLTLGQIDRMVNRERALKGDPGIPFEERQDILSKLSNQVTAAVLRLAAEESTQ